MSGLLQTDRLADRWNCQPLSLFSWNFQLTSARGDTAELTFNFFTEQGTIRLNADSFDVIKFGPFSGRWQLLHRDTPIVDANKPHLTRRFEVHCGNQHIDLCARSPFTRCYDINRAGKMIGSIAPAHLFTRRSTMTCDAAAAVPAPAQLLCFWLAALTWRRAARNNNGAAASAG